jgi:hypothetical protein
MGISAGFSLGKGGTGDSKTVSGAAQNIGKHSGEVSSVSGGLNASSGRTLTKETVLTDLIGNTVNITTGEHTALIGATMAAKDADGTDNGQLSLNTKSFDFADLSNTSYDSQRSAGISANVGIGDKPLTAEQKAAQINDPTQNSAINAKGEKEGRLNAPSIAYSNNSSYSKSKTLATLGEGAVTIADDQASGEDSTERLNRDTDNTTKDLYSIDRQQGNVDLTVDTRLLTEDGRKQIKEDIKRTHLAGSVIADVATKEEVRFKDMREHIEVLQKDLDVQKQLAANGGEHAKNLDNPDATPEQKQAAVTAYAQAYASVFGITIDDAKVIASQRFTPQGLIAGAHYAEDGSSSSIYINDSVQSNGLAYAETIGHEVTHAQIKQGALNDRENETVMV